MSDLLANVRIVPLKVREMIRLPEADGWVLDRISGSHRVYTHRVKRGIVVIPGALGKDLPPGTERSIPETGGTEESSMTTYAIVIERAEDGGYGAWAPDLPGCVALGDSEQECVDQMREAVALYLQVLRERGDAVPEPTTHVATVTAA